MKILVALNGPTNWRSFVNVPREVREALPEMATQQGSREVILSLESKELTAEPETDLLLAIQTVVNRDEKVCEPAWLCGCRFTVAGVNYCINHVFDQDDHQYGWYIV